ncbi:DUF7426 family protein [Gordonia sp. (in: high G+C Gram-positive bacteria)]|uniref:DUF7426 family protein n=1 Tax=Gordonia sp. (in: high G+C Gram-positive bacteria) TaxID=84139 RepID=UPI003C7237A6
MGFEDLRKFHDPDLLLPINGKTYRIPQPDALRGLAIQQLFAAKVLGDSTELSHIMEILGAEWVPDVRDVETLDPVTGLPIVGSDGKPMIERVDVGTWSGGVWSEMAADGLSWEEVMHAGRTALIDVGLGRVVAEGHWVQGIAPSLDLPDTDGAVPEVDSGNPLPAEPEPMNRAARRATTKKAPAKKAPAKKAAAKKA